MRSLFSFSFLLILWWTASCQYEQELNIHQFDTVAQSASGKHQDTLSPSLQSRHEEMLSSTGKTFCIDIDHPKGASLSDITVSFKGDTTTRLSLSDQDPVSNMFKADLDGNGYDEIYFVTTSAGSGSYGKLCGFASNRDKSVSFIDFPNIEEADIQQGGVFYGYTGHDVFVREGSKIKRSFTVQHHDRDTIKQIYYTLQRTETGYRLVSVL